MLDKIGKPNVLTNKKNETSFKGPETALLTGLRGLNNSPAVGACAVDFFSMVTPRTIVETKNRGFQSGFETFFREVTSCVIHACVGVIGLGAATLLSGKFNDKYGIKAQQIFASGNTIRNMSALYQDANGDTKEFFLNFLKKIKGLNGTEWRELSAQAGNDIADDLVMLAQKTNSLLSASGNDKKVLNSEIKELKNLILSKITKDTGASASYKFKSAESMKTVSASLSELVDNAVVLSNSFKATTLDKLPEFVNALIKNKTASTALGLGICAVLCMSVQPINRWLTKKRTGQDGFVGVKNRQADNSKEFKTMKTAMGIAFPAFAISTIGKLSDFASNVQFNSIIPTINQFKFLYGLTIGSRFMSARDKNELREGVIKDSLGFLTWLIFGGMVSKLTARAMGGKELINNPIAKENSKKGLGYAFNWLTKTSVKSFDEVLLPNAKELVKDGKVMKFNELFKNVDNSVKSKIWKIAASQIAGYLFSGIVLGVGIAKLNIFITKKLEEKRNTENIKQSSDKSKLYGYDYLKNIELNTVFKDFQ